MDLRQDVARATVLFFATQRRHDAERARVIAAHGHGHPAGVRGLALGRQDGGELLEGVNNLNLRFVIVTGTLEQRGQRRHVVGAKDGINPRRVAQHGVLILLREATSHGNLHTGVVFLRLLQVAQRAVEALIGVLTHGARVEHDEVRLLFLRGGNIASLFEQARDALRVVDVHLAAEGSHFIGTRGAIWVGAGALCDLAEGGLRINSSDGVLGVSSVHGGAHVGSF